VEYVVVADAAVLITLNRPSVDDVSFFGPVKRLVSHIGLPTGGMYISAMYAVGSSEEEISLGVHGHR
jgi:hypothetical protein